MIDQAGPINRSGGGLNTSVSIESTTPAIDHRVQSGDRVVVLRDRHKISELTGAEIDQNRIMHAIAHADEAPDSKRRAAVE